ncbi:MAG: imidazole glycerol phosphate synthase subunit HisF [Planctomycetes bacterium]|nr:imidazole glycerol phosphate synthase subunit HisF [Planctomycetota bacterium]
MKRIIPCLDVNEDGVVKGVRFDRLRRVGDPVALAERYDAEGADELVFLDIAATIRGRRPLLDILERVAERVFLPVTAGGGVRRIEDARDLLLAGADKVAINTAAVQRPELLSEAASRFGAQCVVLAVDVRRRPGGWDVVTHAGTYPADRDALEWCARAERLGAGELLVTSMDADGTRSGYDLELYRLLAAASGLPVIASGGAGGAEDIHDVLEAGADAALAASIFHEALMSVGQLKRALAQRGQEVRL